jgi:hypothetical protein
MNWFDAQVIHEPPPARQTNGGTMNPGWQAHLDVFGIPRGVKLN